MLQIWGGLGEPTSSNALKIDYQSLRRFLMMCSVKRIVFIIVEIKVDSKILNKINDADDLF